MSDSYDSDPYMDIDIPGSSESLDSSSRGKICYNYI